MPGNAGVSRSAFIVRARDQFAAAYLENHEGGGQGLGGRHFNQGGRPTVVIGVTFQRDFSAGAM